MTIAVLHDKSLNAGPAPEVLALQALGHVAGDPDLGPRFLALSGLDASGLRAAAGEPALLAAVIAFLAGRDADLIACADVLGVAPAALVAAGVRLGDAA